MAISRLKQFVRDVLCNDAEIVSMYNKEGKLTTLSIAISVPFYKQIIGSTTASTYFMKVLRNIAGSYFGNSPYKIVSTIHDPIHKQVLIDIESLSAEGEMFRYFYVRGIKDAEVFKV